MVQRRTPSPATPAEAFAGGPPPSIAIISQRRISIQPIPGQVQDQVAVTYRITPSPPSVLFVPLEQLPAWAWRRDHPDRAVPDALEQQNDEVLRRLIQQRRQPAGPGPRMI